jgi:hypothetical protein
VNIAIKRARRSPTNMQWTRDVVRSAFHFLNEAKTLVGGDVDRLHILFAFGLTQACGPAAQDALNSDGVYLNALSISQMTNIPRETARRKLKEMVSEGMMTQDADRGYALKDPDLVFHLAEPLYRLGGRNAQSSEGAE